ncbi:MAG: tyrosine-protein phosphatase [Solirubrobacterales bacterium]
MIDLHCHILPGIDDGARDMADSVALAQQAEADGVATVCATPHIRHDHDVRIHELPERVADVNDALRAAGVPVAVAPGGEVAETAVAGLGRADLEAVSLGGGGWILLEPAPGPLGDSLRSTAEQLQAGGFGVVIAHPERHPSADLAERLGELAAAGALIQVTAALLAAGPAREAMLALAGRGLVHIVASDAHSSHGGRPLRLSEGIAALRGLDALRPHIDWIAREAPAAILRGERPQPPF